MNQPKSLSACHICNKFTKSAYKGKVELCAVCRSPRPTLKKMRRTIGKLNKASILNKSSPLSINKLCFYVGNDFCGLFTSKSLLETYRRISAA
jgi:hypothetical protein